MRLGLVRFICAIAPLPLALLVNGCNAGTAPTDFAMPGDLSSTPNDLAADASAPPDLCAGDLLASDAAVDPLAGRPYHLKVPAGYNAASPTPLLLMLHGYSSDALMHEAYFQFAPLADTQGFLYAYPDGTPDIIGKRGWNATDACCFFQPNKPDDVAYLTAVLDDVTAKYNVDPKRVFVLGHSNGGFMTNRIACELSPRIAAIVSMAGDVWKDPTLCATSSPVAMLQLQADNDPTINYNGGQIFILAPPYPSAHETVATWASKDGCGPTLATSVGTVDLVSSVAGAETTIDRYSGCAGNGVVELWTMHGIATSDTPHQPPINASFAATMWSFLSAHPKP